MKVSLPYQPDGPNFREEEDKKRGKITGFSASSQRRAREVLNMIPADDILKRGLLLTLTYPDEHPEPEDSKSYKRHLDMFGKSVRRMGGCAIWVLEFQSRGAAHYHLIVFGLRGKRTLEEWNVWASQRWYEIVASGDENHLLGYGAKFEHPRSSAQCRTYLTKYCTKGNQAKEGVHSGRYWGYIGRSDIPFAEETVEEVTEAQGVIALRTVRKAIQHDVWLSAWGRLRKRFVAAAEKFPQHVPGAAEVFSTISDVEFREICDRMKKGKGSTICTKGGKFGISQLGVFLYLSLACGGKPRFPRRWRSRNNRSANLFRNATEFRKCLYRHPAWNHEEKETAKQQDERKLWGDCRSAGEHLGRTVDGGPERCCSDVSSLSPGERSSDDSGRAFGPGEFADAEGVEFRGDVQRGRSDVFAQSQGSSRDCRSRARGRSYSLDRTPRRFEPDPF